MNKLGASDEQLRAQIRSMSASVQKRKLVANYADQARHEIGKLNLLIWPQHSTSDGGTS